MTGRISTAHQRPSKKPRGANDALRLHVPSPISHELRLLKPSLSPERLSQHRPEETNLQTRLLPAACRLHPHLFEEVNRLRPTVFGLIGLFLSVTTRTVLIPFRGSE
jgi:hypothetical protein